MAMTAFGGVGYYLHGVEIRQNELIQKKKEEIIATRERLQAVVDANKSGNGGEEE